MPYLMHIAFDNSSRLDRNVYYFKYKGIRFKLIQNSQKYQDVLLTILSDPNDQEERIYKIASEHLSTLSWENRARVICGYSGGAARREITLRKAKCSMFDFRRIPRGYYAQGYNILIIPKIENDRQRKALSLFRQALSNLNPYFSFLFYWHVLGVGGREPPEVCKWIDGSFKRKGVHVPKEDLTRLGLGKRRLGEYLKENCRNAIAHIEGPQGRKELEIDDLKDLERIHISTSIIEEFARFCIKNGLGLNKKLYLVRRNGRGFPVYVAEDELERKAYKIAYEKKSPFPLNIMERRKKTKKGRISQSDKANKEGL